MINFLKIKNRRNVTETALGEKDVALSDENPDLEPMEIGAMAIDVNAQASMRALYGG